MERPEEPADPSAEGDDVPRPPVWYVAQVLLISTSLVVTWFLIDFLVSWAEAESIRNGPHQNLVERLEYAGVITRPRPEMRLASRDGVRAAHDTATDEALARAEARLRANLGQPVEVSSELLSALRSRGFERALLPGSERPRSGDVLAFERTREPRGGSPGDYELYLLSREQGGWWALLHGDGQLSVRRR